MIGPFDSLEAPETSAQHDLQLHSTELCQKVNSRLVIQVLLYTNSKYRSFGFSWEEFVSWVESMSPPQLAARFGLASVVYCLWMTVPEDITKVDNNGATPLHAVAFGSDEGVVDFLLEKAFVMLFETFCDTESSRMEDIGDLISYYASVIVGKSEKIDKRLGEFALIQSVEDGKMAIVRCFAREWRESELQKLKRNAHIAHRGPRVEEVPPNT